MKNSTKAVLALVAVSTLAVPAQAQMRRNIRIVGSSTVYPFSKAVAERFSRTNPGVPAPIVESTGTGGGMKLFCAGVGGNHPDITNASRRIKASEFRTCQANGVAQITEIAIGLDGLALATGERSQAMALTTRDVYAALAATPFGKTNTAKTWKDVNPKLPAVAIRVYGPPSTSGTRDSLHELIMKPGCNSNGGMAAMAKTNAAKYDQICTKIRTDGAYVEQGENDNLIVQKIAANPKALGIFGFSFLEENMDKLKGVPVGGIAPTYQTVSDFSYPGARPLYIYVKAAHLKSIKGINEFAAEFAKNWGPDGALKGRGMVVAPEDVRTKAAGIVQSMTPLDPSELK